MTTKNSPEVWSDFDGTAVETVGIANPRNWLKYPLAMIAGYSDFLSGINVSGSQVAGVVSRRPDIFPRRLATHLSMYDHDINRVLKNNVVLTGSESKKGLFVAHKAMNTVVGLLEDKPHRIGVEVVKALSATVGEYEVAEVVIGVPQEDDAFDKIARFERQMCQKRDEFGLGFIGTDLDSKNVTIYGEGGFTVRVMPLEGYSFESGTSFGSHLVDLYLAQQPIAQQY